MNGLTLQIYMHWTNNNIYFLSSPTNETILVGLHPISTISFDMRTKAWKNKMNNFIKHHFLHQPPLCRINTSFLGLEPWSLHLRHHIHCGCRPDYSILLICSHNRCHCHQFLLLHCLLYLIKNYLSVFFFFFLFFKGIIFLIQAVYRWSVWKKTWEGRNSRRGTHGLYVRDLGTGIFFNLF